MKNSARTTWQLASADLLHNRAWTLSCTVCWISECMRSAHGGAPRHQRHQGHGGMQNTWVLALLNTRPRIYRLTFFEGHNSLQGRCLAAARDPHSAGAANADGTPACLPPDLLLLLRDFNLETEVRLIVVQPGVVCCNKGNLP